MPRRVKRRKFNYKAIAAGIKKAETERRHFEEGAINTTIDKTVDSEFPIIYHFGVARITPAHITSIFANTGLSGEALGTPDTQTLSTIYKIKESFTWRNVDLNPVWIDVYLIKAKPGAGGYQDVTNTNYDTMEEQVMNDFYQGYSEISLAADLSAHMKTKAGVADWTGTGGEFKMYTDTMAFTLAKCASFRKKYTWKHQSVHLSPGDTWTFSHRTPQIKEYVSSIHSATRSPSFPEKSYVPLIITRGDWGTTSANAVGLCGHSLVLNSKLSCKVYLQEEQKKLFAFNEGTAFPVATAVTGVGMHDVE